LEKVRRYQLESVLAQVKHLKRAQVLESGSVSEWVFPLEKELEKALESLRAMEKAQALAQETVQGQVTPLVLAEEKVEVLESGWVQDELPLEWE
jgi:hypothetical protein